MGLSLPQFNYTIIILACFGLSQSTTVSHVMSAHLEVIETNILGVSHQLPFPLHSGEEKQTAAMVQDERGSF